MARDWLSAVLRIYAEAVPFVEVTGFAALAYIETQFSDEPESYPWHCLFVFAFAVLDGERNSSDAAALVARAIVSIDHTEELLGLVYLAVLLQSEEHAGPMGLLRVSVKPRVGRSRPKEIGSNSTFHLPNFLRSAGQSLLTSSVRMSETGKFESLLLGSTEVQNATGKTVAFFVYRAWRSALPWTLVAQVVPNLPRFRLPNVTP